jgi:hypothetical protein
MQMLLNGDLSESSLAEVFNFIQEVNKTGVLSIETRSNWANFLKFTEELLLEISCYFVSLAMSLQIKHEEEIERDKKYINHKGGGKRSSLSVEEEIYLCVFYLRQLPTFEILGMQFGISKSRANSIFYHLKLQANLFKISENIFNKFR